MFPIVYASLKTENSQSEPQSIYSPLQHSDITVLWKFRQLFWLRNRQCTQRLRNPTCTSSMWDALLLRQQDQKRTGQIPNKVGEQMCVSSKLPGFPISIYICRESYLIPTQGICYVLLHVTENSPIMDHSLKSGTLYYILTYIPTHLLPHNDVIGYFCF